MTKILELPAQGSHCSPARLIWRALQQVANVGHPLVTGLTSRSTLDGSDFENKSKLYFSNRLFSAHFYDYT